MAESLFCLLSWRYTYQDNQSQYVIAGLPIKQNFEKLPEIGEVLSFTPTVTALYGAGESIKLAPITAKVSSIEPSNCKAFDHTIVLEVQYEQKEKKDAGTTDI